MKQLQDIPIRVLESGYPAAPVLPLRRAEKLYTRATQSLILLLDVIYSQVDHDAIRVPGWSIHLVMETKVEPRAFAHLEGNESRTSGVQGKLKEIVIEAEHPLQILGPQGYANDSSDHGWTDV